MTTPMPEQCGASARIQIGPMPYIGPCVLRHGHDGPVHQDADGAQWTDPRPATAEDSAALCPPKQPDPHPYMHLTYGPWEPSGHQCWDIQPGGCDDVPPERKVFARWNGVGEERFVGWDLGDCPSCGPVSSLRERLRRALHAYDTDIDARAVDNLVPAVEAWAAEQSPSVLQGAPTAGSNGLREQFAEALRVGLRQIPGVRAKPRPGDRAEQLADAILPVVEAEIVKVEQRYTALAELHVNVCAYGVELQKRAEKAEAAVRRSREALARTAFGPVPTSREVLNAWRASLGSEPPKEEPA